MTTFTTDCSISFWLKINTWNSSYATFFQAGLGSSPWTHYIFGFLRNSTNSTICFTISNGSSASNASYLTSTIELNKWYHITLTYTTDKCKIYLNGLLDHEYVTSIIPAFSSITTITLGRGNSNNYQTNCNINDFRIYDHCLSPLEVKEISQGLILHYKLDDPYIEETTNLCGTNAGGWNNSGTCTRTTNDTAILYPPTSSNTYSIRATSDGSMALTCGTTTANHPSKTIVASVYVWLDGTQDGSSFYLRSNKTNGSVGNLTYNGNANPSTWPQRQWIRINTAPIATASDATSFYICTYVNKNTEVRAVNGWQIEEKNHITPYTAPGTTRSMGTLIQDSSGYGYNGEIISELHISNDSARYKNSILLDGVDDCIIVPYNTMCPENIFTINLWFKKDALGSKNYETLFGGPGGFEMDTRAGSATSLSLYMASTRSGNRATGITMNEWHMITMIRDGTTEKYYVDGEFKSEIEAKPMPHGIYRIGAWASNTGQNYYGLISDFRIYCTALLDADIKMLYNTAMKIDNLNNIHTYELDEKGRELLNGVPLTSGYSTHSTTSSIFNGEAKMTGNGSLGSDYIKINPTGHTYYYDIIYSCATGNQFYIGFEKYDASKTARSNNACVYVVAVKPTADQVKVHVKGAVDLATDGVNPTDTIALRVLNGWSGSDSSSTKTMTIHYMSLREVATNQKPQVLKSGEFVIEELREYNNAKFYQNGMIETAEIIEM